MVEVGQLAWWLPSSTAHIGGRRLVVVATVGHKWARLIDVGDGRALRVPLADAERSARPAPEADPQRVATLLARLLTKPWAHYRAAEALEVLQKCHGLGNT